MYPSFQIQSYGSLKDGLTTKNRNYFPLRDLFLHIDNWMFFKNDDEYTSDEVIMIMQKFNKDIDYCRYSDKVYKSIMTTSTLDRKAMTSMEEDWRSYYPSEIYHKLKLVKKENDPINLFRNEITIPL
jgi:hypothetical protein